MACTLCLVQISSVQSLSRVRLFVTPWTTARQAPLSITSSRSLPKPMPIESVMPSSHLILCRPLLLLPPIPPSIRVFSNESTLCFSISPSNEHAGLISFRMDWLDLLAVQGTLKSLLQHHSSEASILQRSQLSSQSNSHIHTCAWLGCYNRHCSFLIYGAIILKAANWNYWCGSLYFTTLLNHTVGCNLELDDPGCIPKCLQTYFCGRPVLS